VCILSHGTLHITPGASITADGESGAGGGGAGGIIILAAQHLLRKEGLLYYRAGDGEDGDTDEAPSGGGGGGIVNEFAELFTGDGTVDVAAGTRGNAPLVGLLA